jgi:hypothetical protein
MGLLHQPTTAEIIARLEEKWGADVGCPMCGAKPPKQEWFVRRTTPMIVLPSDNNPGEPRRTMPMAAVVCSNCGYTIFVNTILLLKGSEG